MSPGDPPRRPAGPPGAPEPSRPTAGCLYLLQANANGLFRLGVTDDWSAAAPGLGVGATTRVIGVAQVNAPAHLLHFLQHRLAPQRLAGSEWYRLDGEAVAFLEALLAKAQDDFRRGNPQAPPLPWSGWRPPLEAVGRARPPETPRPPRSRRAPSPRRVRGFAGGRGGPAAEVVELLLLTPLALMLAGLAFLVPPLLVGALSLGAAVGQGACRRPAPPAETRSAPGRRAEPTTDQVRGARAECRVRIFWLGFWVSLPAWGLALLLWLARRAPAP